MKLLVKIAMACAMGLAAPLAQAEEGTVAIAAPTAPFHLPSVVMQKMDYLEAAFAGRGVTLQAAGAAEGMALAQKLGAGELQIAAGLESGEVILARAQGAEIVVIGAYARAPKAHAIMANVGGVTEISALKGKTVAGPKGTVLHRLLIAALAAEGMGLGDVAFIAMDQPRARAALLAGEVDAALLSGEAIAQVGQAGGYAILDGAGLIEPIELVVASKAFAEASPDLVAAYHEAHLEALDFIRVNPAVALRFATEELGISLAEAERRFALYDFTPVMGPVDLENLAEEQEFMIAEGLMEASAKLDLARDLIAPVAGESQ